MHDADETPRARTLRRFTLAAFGLMATAMVALPAIFVLPAQIGEPVAAPPARDCRHLGPDFEPVRLRMPDGGWRSVCALFGAIGRE